MTIRKSNPYLTLVNSYLIDSPQPSSINYWWNLGSLLGLCLVIQIASGIFLAMHVRRCAFFVILGKVRYYFVDIIKPLILGIARNHLLNLAWWEKVCLRVNLLSFNISGEVSNLWLKLYYLKVNFQSHQAGCLTLDSYGSSLLYNDAGMHGIVTTMEMRCISNTNIKGMSYQPKETNILNKGWTTVSTKESNFYVEGNPNNSVMTTSYANFNRLGNTVSMQKRGLAICCLRQYSTGSGKNNKNVLDRLNDLNNFSIKYPNKPIDRDLYSKFILNKELLIFAYHNLKSKPGMMTPGINPTTLDGISDELLDNIILKLRNQSFKFSPVRKIEIDKPSGGKRPLSLGSPTDKLVQEVIRMVLEAIYEPQFSVNSHGFRKHHSCHTALRYVFTQFRGCTWWIEGDIKKCFDTIPHDKLINLLEMKIKDKRFVDLIRKAINAGYMFERRIIFDIIGTPQGSIISPILANIYLDQLDKFIEDLKTKFDSGLTNRSRYNRLTEYRSIESKIRRIKASGSDDKKLLRVLSNKLKNTPTRTKSEVDNKLMYVRYADDWIVAVNGRYKDAVHILELITNFSRNELGLTISPEKTKITNTYKDNVTFLGTNIKHSTRRDIIIKRGRKSKSPGMLLLTAPINKIAKKLFNSGFHVDHKGKTKTSWLALELPQIIYLANSVIRGYLNYYSFVYNRNRLTGYVKYIIRDSVLRTIAAKMNLKTRAQVTKKYGNNVTINTYDNNNSKLKKSISLLDTSKDYKMNVWKFNIKDNVSTHVPALYSNYVSLASVLAAKCEICSSEYRVEMHHIRKLSDLKADKSDLGYLMSKMKRKQIPLCRDCHMKHHSGNLTIPKEILDKFNKKKK